MTDNEERAWDKVVELEDLCKSFSLSLKGRDDLLNATLKEKAEYLAEERREREMFEKIYIFEVGTQSYNLCECCGEHNYCSLVSGKVYYV